ncbi:hypothetical protein GUK30_14065 [Rhizobium leguminosarum]|uniref:hypothetical protein n=1 Tax=Rhizobium ruizarguesonis TaxID=2081791 RepID=UPI0013C1EBCC|nr:hypothetical protein [Rhizobium ruizarguesonis]NEI20535.1 hypothetical protein [Rhizobium ruizarguesonis]
MNLHVTTADRTLLPRGLIKRPRSAAELRIVGKVRELINDMNAAQVAGNDELNHPLLSTDGLRREAAAGKSTTPEPAALPPHVPVRRFKFRLGARVVFGGMHATVVGRDASWCGRQLYRIHIAEESYGRPFRLVAGPQLERDPEDAGRRSATN